MDDLVYAKYINKYIGYGVFAKKNIRPHTIVG